MAKTKHTKTSKISAKKEASPSAKKTAKLSALEDELLECAEKGQPVLLHGKDTRREREQLVREIHSQKDGIDASWEYTGEESNINSPGDIYNAMMQALEEKDMSKTQGILMTDYDKAKAQRFLMNSNDTSRTWRRVDCDFESGENVFDILLNKFELFGGNSYRFTMKGFPMTDVRTRVENLYKDYKKFLMPGKCFLNCKGLLFVDNLKCTRNDPKDEEWYYRLAQEIESVKERDTASDRWLVAYTYDRKTFPKYFRDQFKLVPLDSEDYEEKQQVRKTGQEKVANIKYEWSINSERTVCCNGKEITKLPPIQFKLFECLRKKQGRDVKNKTLENCWGDNLPNYVAFLSNAMSELNTNLESGLKELHIEIKHRIIESKKDNKTNNKNVAYKLVT
jgi:hypothetical protein